MRVCAIPSTSFTVSSRPITSLTSSFRQSRITRAAILPLQRRLVQNEAVQAEHDADEVDGAERSELGDNTISEGIGAGIQENAPEISPSASLQNATSPSSAAEAATDEGVHEASSAAAATETNLFGDGPSTGYRREVITPCQTIYIGNISFDTTEADIAKQLESAGGVKDVKIVKDARGFSRG